MKNHIIFFLIFTTAMTFAQHVGINTNTPQTDLDVREINPSSPLSSAGIAFPSVTSIPVSGNNTGQVIFNQNEGAFYVYDGINWNKITDNGTNHKIGDFKSSHQLNDHNGWIKLDGRTISGSSLTPNQIANATALGMTTSLLNMEDKVFKMKPSGIGNILDEGGNQKSIQLTIANLPDVNFNATVNPDGAHSHVVSNRPTGLGNNANTGGRNTSIANGNTSLPANIHEHTATLELNASGTVTPLNVSIKNINTNQFIFLGID